MEASVARQVNISSFKGPACWYCEGVGNPVAQIIQLQISNDIVLIVMYVILALLSFCILFFPCFVYSGIAVVSSHWEWPDAQLRCLRAKSSDGGARFGGRRVGQKELTIVTNALGIKCCQC